MVKFDGTMAENTYASGITSENIFRDHYQEGDVMPEGKQVGDIRPGVYCIGGLSLSPLSVNASSNINYAGPAIVSSTLGEAGECADIPDVDVQVSVFVVSHQYPHAARDATFNLQVWGS